MVRGLASNKTQKDTDTDGDPKNGCSINVHRRKLTLRKLPKTYGMKMVITFS